MPSHSGVILDPCGRLGVHSIASPNNIPHGDDDKFQEKSVMFGVLIFFLFDLLKIITAVGLVLTMRWVITLHLRVV